VPQIQQGSQGASKWPLQAASGQEGVPSQAVETTAVLSQFFQALLKLKL